MKYIKKHPIYLQTVLAALILPGMMFVSRPAHAQKDSSGDPKESMSVNTDRGDNYRDWRKRSLSSFYVQGGITNIDVDAINGRFARAGYDTIDSPAMSMGFGFNHRFKRLITGLDWHFLMHNTPESPDDNMRTDMRNWYWQLSYGADMVQLESLSVYALAGIGVGHTSIWITQESGDSFNGVLNEPARSTFMSQTSLVLSATLGVDYRIELRKTERKTSYLAIGLRGGYLFSPFAGDWRTHGADIQNGPDRGLNGPVALLTVGMSRQWHHDSIHKKRK